MYANDQGAATSLVAVTARTNRSKADQDPADRLPPATDQYCRYIGEWTGTRLRWDLTSCRGSLPGLRDGGRRAGAAPLPYALFGP